MNELLMVTNKDNFSNYSPASVLWGLSARLCHDRNAYYTLEEAENTFKSLTPSHI